MSPKKRHVDPVNSSMVRRTDYTKTLDTIATGGFCPFCEEHLFKHHRRPLNYRSRHWLVTENAWPYKGSRFHYLFIARSHVKATEDLSPSMWNDLQNVYRKLIKEKHMRGATLLMRSGDTKYTGATVNHLHAQLIVGGPRKKTSKPIKALVGFKK